MYGYYYFDPTYLLLVIGMVLSLLASAKVKSTFSVYKMCIRDRAESVQIQNKKGETTQITKLTCEIALSDAETDISVSYTHLDVYKRQA